MIKKHFLVFAAIAAIFTVSCASTPSSGQKENSIQNLEEKPENSDSALKNEDNKTSEVENPAIEEKSPNENPLETTKETAIEQNLPENNSENLQGEPKTEENQISNQISEDKISEEPKNETAESENNPKIDFQASEENVKYGEKEFEKVAEEDLPFEKQSENAPLEAESKIFSEPNVIDISEEPEVFEENQENSESEKQNPQNEESGELGKTETAGEYTENLAETAESANADKNKNSDETNGINKIIEEKSETTQDSNETINKDNKAEAALKDDSEAENQKSGENKDLTLPENKQDEEKIPQDSDSEKIAPSRKVTIKRKQNLYVVYPGNGWIYIGEEKTPALLTYFGRMTNSSSTTFTLRSDNAGETLLHFYKNDALTGKSIDDYLLVTVEDKIASPDEKTLAPSYAEIVPPQFQKRQNGISSGNEKTSNENSKNENISGKNQNLKDNGSNVNTLESENSKNGNSGEKSYVQNPRENRENQEFSSNDVKTFVSTPEKQNPQKRADSSGSGNLYLNQKNDSQKSNPKDETSSFFSKNENEVQQNFALEPEVQTADEEIQSGEELLEKAKSLFNEKKYAESLESCLDCINGSNENLDEAYYLLGQIYEAESPVKNIRNALDAYTEVTKNYPLSKLWQKANQRSVYLKRFYIDIR